MHLEILIEDLSGKKALDIIIPGILGLAHTFKVHSYKGVGRIPKGLKGTSDPDRRILLDQHSLQDKGLKLKNSIESCDRHYSWKYWQPIHRTDGYNYNYQKEAAIHPLSRRLRGFLVDLL